MFIQVGVELLHLLLGDLHLLQTRGDLFEGEVATFLALGDQTTEFIQLAIGASSASSTVALSVTPPELLSICPEPAQARLPLRLPKETGE